jgi:hypothetical protein
VPHAVCKGETKYSFWISVRQTEREKHFEDLGTTLECLLEEEGGCEEVD